MVGTVVGDLRHVNDIVLLAGTLEKSIEMTDRVAA